MKSMKTYCKESYCFYHAKKFSVLLMALSTILFSCNMSNTKSTDNSGENTQEGTTNVIKSTNTRSFFISKKFGKVVVDERVFESTYEEFNKEGKLIAKTDSGSFSSVEKSNYVYDNKGNNIEININNEDGSLESKKTNKINELGQISEQINYDSKGEEIAVFKFKYDKKGNMIARKTVINGENKFTTRYKYDKKGNKVYEWDGSIENGQSTYDYEFDEKGNWITSSEYVGGKKCKIFKREIKYY